MLIAYADPPAAPAPAPTPAPTPAATTTAYTTNNLNQYTRVGAATYAYDKNGNLTSDGSNTYRWDAENRLTGVTIPGATDSAPATTVSYAYDDFHRRVKKTVGTATTYFLWSGDRLLAEYAGNGTLKRRYLYAEGFAPVQVHDVAGATTSSYDVHTDHLDTPRLLTNSTGAAVWTSRHRAFGQAHIETDPDGDGTSLTFPFRFPGQYEDAETGLHYNWHRYYHPRTGRYLSADPVPQRSDNLYLYAGNNSQTFIDPLGLYLVTPVAPPPTVVIHPAVPAFGVGYAVGTVIEPSVTPYIQRALDKIFGNPLGSGTDNGDDEGDDNDEEEECRRRDRECVRQFVEDTEWCARNQRGRAYGACIDRAKDNLIRCNRGGGRLPRMP